METFNDLKKLWVTHDTAIPNMEIFYNEVQKFKRNSLLKLIGFNALIIITIAFIALIWYYFQPQFISTKIGIVLVIFAITLFIIPYNSQLIQLFENDAETNSKEYFKQLKKIQEIRGFQQTTILNAYFFFLSLGFGLYLFEYVAKMNMVWGITTYGATAIWVALNWFYIRPKVIEKQNTKLNELLTKLSELNNQMID
jgi:membrane protein YdbS with pleckstrin-like domain